MKIIEIRETDIGEVAYVLNEGRIYKMMVEDLTGAALPPLKEFAPRQKVKPVMPVPIKTIDEGLTIDDIPDDLPMAPRRAEQPIPELGKVVPKLPKGPIPKGIPRDMVDIFRKPPDLA
jgi:hypothetical protein